MTVYLWTGSDTDTYFALSLMINSSLVIEEIRKWWTDLMIDSLQHAIATQTQYAPVIAVRHSPIPQIQFPASNILHACPSPWPESEAVHVGPSSNDPLTLSLSTIRSRVKAEVDFVQPAYGRSWQYGGSRERWQFGLSWMMDDDWWTIDDYNGVNVLYRSHVRNPEFVTN